MGLTTALLIGGGVAAGIALSQAAAPKPADIPEAPEVAELPPMPTVDKEEVETGVAKRRRKGRATTIVTGELEPETLGKKTLLGG